jgi:hypothetical protein
MCGEMKIISYQEAKALELKRYFTGKSCKRGHICERLVSSRSCVICSYKQHRERQHQLYRKDPEAALERFRRRYREYREAALERGRKHYWANREAVLERQRQWRRENPEAIRKESRRRNLQIRRALAVVRELGLKL